MMETGAARISCLRCNAQLDYVETTQFVGRSGVFNLLPAAALSNTEPIELYSCSSCGHVELFLERKGGAKRERPKPMTASRVAGLAVGRLLKKGSSMTAKNHESKSRRR
jgi:hypothetical protein